MAKRISGLDCSAPADKMVRLVLRTQLKMMCALRDTALDWHDPEGVHDMRVRSRRLRSAMSDFRPYLRKASLPRLKLRSIARSLGEVRDEDVALMALEELKSKAKGQAAEGIEVLMEERRKKQKEARSALQKAINQSVLRDFRQEFLTRLRAIAIVSRRRTRGSLNTHEVQPFGRLGLEVIEARMKEFVAGSRHLYFPFQIKELHELRIMAKRLRYAIELFAVCWGQEMEEIAKEVALMQTSLGELHDCDVWIEGLSARLKQTARKARDDDEIARLRDGAVFLLSHFARERMEHYRDALSRWQQWEADGFLEKTKSIMERNRFPPLPAEESSSPIDWPKPSSAEAKL